MNSTGNDKQTYNRRGWLVAAVVLVMFIFLLLLNIRGFLFIKRAGNQFEASMDHRLRISAATATTLIEDGLFSLYDPVDIALMRLNLVDIRESSESQAAYLIDADYNPIVDADLSGRPISRSYLRQDSLDIAKAQQNGFATSQLYLIEGNPFKNAYSRIQDQNGNQAILVLEANADFFDTLRFYRSSLVLNSIISGILFCFLTLFLIIATRRFFRTEKQLQESQRLAALGQMSATMAHEIRNPLGIIKSTSDLISEKYQHKDNPDELFQFINEEIQRLNHLVNDFLTFSRKPVLNKSICDLDEIISDAIIAVRREHHDRIRIDYQSEQNIQTECDANKIFQVLLNILLNAVQAIGNTDGGIVISMKKVKSSALLSIQDDGPGFTDSADKIFEPFLTTKTQGTGLGLAVSKSIIEEHGGKITAENAETGGARISFTLPLI